MTLWSTCTGVDVQFAELAANSFMLIKGHVLIAKEEYLMPKQRLIHLSLDAGIQRGAEINAADFGANNGGHCRKRWLALHRFSSCTHPKMPLCDLLHPLPTRTGRHRDPSHQQTPGVEFQTEPYFHHRQWRDLRGH